MSTIFHNYVNFQKCPKCNGQLTSASYCPDGLLEGDIIRCEDCFLGGKLKFTKESFEIDWEKFK